jgi:hypothetical protein
MLNPTLTLRQQRTVRNDWLRERLRLLMAELMARADLDMWIVICREYNEDPVVLSLLPQPTMSARRRTILVFQREPDGSVSHFGVSRYPVAGFYETVWEPTVEDQFDCLARLITERDPQRIGINGSQTFAFADGLSFTEHAQLVAALPEKYHTRLASSEAMAVGWLERRIDAELTVYPRIVAMGHALIQRAFSAEIIHPGITTTEDVVWWLRDEIQRMGLQAWFQPTVMIQAADQWFGKFLDADKKRHVIQPGDLLHCDVGFHYLGLATDQQQHAYVLKSDETDAPAGIKAALATANRVQDIHLEEMQIGRTGNEVLKAVLGRCSAENIDAMIYSHPLGYHGHAAGPTIGLWDRQDGVAGAGDYPLYNKTCYSIELNITQTIPEWGNRSVRIMLEEDAVLDPTMRWLAGRQSTLHLIV